GKTARVRARRFVLATGGIENARLLLASNRVEKHGVGNRHDLVGRFFMEHPHAHLAEIITDDPYRVLDHYARSKHGEVQLQAALGLSPERQRSERTLNCAALVEYRQWVWGDRPARVARDLARLLRGRGTTRGMADRIRRVILDFDGHLYNTYRRWAGRRALPTPNSLRDLSLLLICEQAPEPRSRVKLGAEVDALGLPRVELDWRMGSLEQHTLRTMAKTLAGELGRLNLGRLRLDPWLGGDAEIPGLGSGVEGDPGASVFEVGSHHIGTTRMDLDPSRGVVDEHCRVHGIDNLFIACSSVFPTSGYANPTLTIVALALRLSDRLKRLGTRDA
ncbi:MAG: GMC family oxidoreductase, partial [Myxococcales bacterium]|nr:GMC family oxidoreductase [Myxococcales bacterium]